LNESTPGKYLFLCKRTINTKKWVWKEAEIKVNEDYKDINLP
jgi:hypothetical protein